MACSASLEAYTRELNISGKGSDYNEEKIVEPIAEIYKILIKMGRWTEDEVKFPPAEGHILDFSRLPDHVVLDLHVISLMRRLPCPPKDIDLKEIVTRMHSINYLDAKSLAESRDVDLAYLRDLALKDTRDPFDYTNAPPTVLLLLQGVESLDPCLVLDVSDNSIRWFGKEELDDEYTRSEPDKKKVDEYTSHHMNWPREPAPAYLNNMLAKFKDARFIPFRLTDGVIRANDEEAWTCELRRILMEVYSWPANFREQAWKREKEDIIDSLQGTL